MMGEIRIGTRGSALALRQTEAIIALLQARSPALRCKVVRIVTHGDRFREKPISAMGEEVDRGIFNTALEQAVLAGEVELATCSFKDVESDLPAGLRAVSVGVREDARDVLVSRHAGGLEALPRGAVLATSSPRRTSQLLAYRPDLRFAPLRGNVTTRVKQESRRYDGVVLAAAGLIRLGLTDHVTQWIDPAILLPAPAQAAMGCEFLAAREDIAALVASIQDPDTELCVRTEKALLVRLSGGCFAPIGVLARLEGGRLHLDCRIVSLDGNGRVEERLEGDPAAPEALVEEAVGRIAAKGGLEIVRATREHLLAGQAASPTG
jgi:hydroxymethylbilane synthase